eukprot:TRINITY_DN17343_c0_g1_i1.p1 TRINITY_DN17343_c0_g1~~TRINITY_DN17343_c0_g1_i1.p1  ORF type:complete len:260 (-),score=50.71 TRINITY_DN17343_c0_g1_i1:63-842(-)
MSAPNSPNIHDHPERVWNVVPAHTTPEQKKVIHQLREALADRLKPEDDDAMLARFCRARAYSFAQTKIMLEEYFRFRETSGHQELSLTPEISDFLKYQTFYFLPKPDKFGRTVMILLPRNWNPGANKAQICTQSFYYLVNTAIRAMKPPKENYVCIVDLNGYGYRNNDFGVLKEQASILQNYYPERMGVSFVVNAPWYIASIYSIIKGWLEERTRRKIHILGGDYQETLLKLIDADALPDFLGGKYVHPPQEADMWAME